LTQHPTDTGFADEEATAEMLHNIEFLEIKARQLDWKRRCAIASVRAEHGLLGDDEKDALELEGKELEEEIRLWRSYAIKPPTPKDRS
jgi:hypothetical protein